MTAETEVVADRLDRLIEAQERMADALEALATFVTPLVALALQDENEPS